VVYLPVFRCEAGQAFDPGQPCALEPGAVIEMVCSTCAARAQGIGSTGVCFSCLKKLKLRTNLPIKHGASISFHEKWRAAENRKGAWVYGPVIPARAYLKAASTRINEIRALSIRQLAPTPEVNRVLFTQLKNWVIANRHDIFPGLDQSTCAFGPQADEQFECWNTKFPKATRNANAKAWPIVKRDCLSDKMLRKVTTIKLFLKSEKYDKAEIGVMDDSLAPRCISSWVAYVNVATFCVSRFHEYLTTVWGDWDRSNASSVKNVCFPAGMNSEQMSSWFTAMMREGVSLIGYEDDFTLFDSTQNQQTHELLLLIYSWTGLNSWPNFQKIREAQAGVCRGVTRHGIRYTDVNTMRSGSADTCLGNTIVNYLYHMFAVAYGNKVGGKLMDFKQLAAKVRMMVLGDDNVTIVDPDIDMSRVTHTINQLGLISKLSRREQPSDCVFLNQWFIHRGGGEYLAMPNFFRLFGKLGFACDEQPDPCAYQYSIAQAFERSFSGVTIASAGIQHLKKVASSRLSPQNNGHNKARSNKPTHAFNRAFGRDYRVVASDFALPTPTADRDFARKCGISGDRGTQDELVAALTSYSSIPCALGSPNLVRCVVALT
jgi:hypothetical protein